jgi:hypothetical protein
MTRWLLRLLLVACAIAGEGVAQENGPRPVDGLARLRALGRPSPRLGENREARGKVTAVDERSITIRGQYGIFAANCVEVDDSGADRFGLCVRKDPTKPIVIYYPGWELDCDRYKITHEGKTVFLLTGETVMVRNADLPVLRLPAASALVEAAPHPGLPYRSRHCHLLSEVKVGDEVELALIGKYGKEECVGVTITRRPGGRIPYSTHSHDFFKDRIDQCNAYQQYEENGTPIPHRFRRDLHRMEMERMDAIRRAAELAVPVAPPPRKVSRPPAP